MFEGLFDFGRTRTLKQSVGFYLFYGGIAVAIYALLTVIGVH